MRVSRRKVRTRVGDGVQTRRGCAGRTPGSRSGCGGARRGVCGGFGWWCQIWHLRRCGVVRFWRSAGEGLNVSGTLRDVDLCVCGVESGVEEGFPRREVERVRWRGVSTRPPWREGTSGDGCEWWRRTQDVEVGLGIWTRIDLREGRPADFWSELGVPRPGTPRKAQWAGGSDFFRRGNGCLGCAFWMDG